MRDRACLLQGRTRTRERRKDVRRAELCGFHWSYVSYAPRFSTIYRQVTA
jgi:hypothetical protein